MAKRAVGLGTVLVLTPLAVVISVAVSCGVQWLANGMATVGGSRGLLMLVVVPLSVLTAMMAWAIWTVRRDQPHGKAKMRRIRKLWLTPLAVAGMAPLGFALAAGIATALYGFEQLDFRFVLALASLLFFTPSGAMLGWMLWSAWKMNDKSVGPSDAPRPSDG